MDTHRHKRPNIRDFFANLSDQRPLAEKIRLLHRNMDEKLYREILERLKANGYDTSRLIRTQQE